MLALVIAQTTVPAIPSEWVWLGAIFGVIILLSGAARNITGVVDFFRQKPPAHEVYATREEMDRLETRTRAEICAADLRSENRAKENGRLIQDKVRELERVLADKINENKQNHTEQFGFLRGELHAQRGTMQNLSNEISRAIGRLEGRGRDAGD